MEWRIYYADGSTYSDDDGPAGFAPKTGAQCVVVADPAVGWVPLWGTSGCDFFCYDGTWDIPRWRNLDRWGFQKYMQEAGYKVVVFGEWMGNHAFQALKSRVTRELGDRQTYPYEQVAELA